MHQRAVIASLVLASVWGSRAGAAPDGGRAPIVGGETARGDLAVVALLDAGGAPFCSGALIAPRVVLTAAHCVESKTRAVDRIFVGTDVDGGGVEVAVDWAEAHPLYDPATLAADLGLVHLAADVSADVIALPVSRVPISEASAGAPLRFVGFGHDVYPGDGIGVKRQVVQEILEVGDADFTYGQATCHGDSGAPALAAAGAGEVIVGVVSAGPPGCRTYGRATRVDRHAAWIHERTHADRPAGGCTAGGAGTPGVPASLLLLAAALRARQPRPRSRPRPPRRRRTWARPSGSSARASRPGSQPAREAASAGG